MSLQTLKLITFDATNTLLKFKVPPWQYYALIASDYGFNGTVDDLKNKMKTSFKIMGEKYPNFGKNTISWESWWRQIVHMTLKDHMPGSADMDKIAGKLINDFSTSKCWCVADGVDQLVDKLKKQGLSVGIISNFDPRLIDVLKDVNLYQNIDFVVTSYEAGCSKPDERIFMEAIDMCKKLVKPVEALHVGDDIEKDYEGARAAGWHAVLINPDISTETPLVPYHLFRNIKEFSSVIDQQSLKL